MVTDTDTDTGTGADTDTATGLKAPGGLRGLCQRHARGEISTAGYRQTRRAFIEGVVAGRRRHDEDANAPPEAPAAEDCSATRPVAWPRTDPAHRRNRRRLLSPLALSLALVVAAWVAFTVFVS
jgi:hypothetical protein